VHAQLPAGSDNRLAEQFKPAQLFQGHGEIDFFAGVKLFVETAHCLEIFPGGEEERARTEIRDGEVERGEEADKEWTPLGD
jgi:hypothetical protein